MTPSQQEKILLHMIRERVSKNWFFPHDFMQKESDELFVGYEASARLSELARSHPEMIESKRDGKYIKRRISWETAQYWLDKIPQSTRNLLSEHIGLNTLRNYKQPELKLF